VLREAADQSVFEMEQAFKAYTDAVKADEEKWKMVAERCLNPKPSTPKADEEKWRMGAERCGCRLSVVGCRLSVVGCRVQCDAGGRVPR
jgi:hypothetical protein